MSQSALVQIQEALPEEYYALTETELAGRTARAKAALGQDLVILGHHYQRDEIIQFADFRGDSFKLAQQAAQRPEARYIVFCGVHFMAETADILSGPHQTAILPDLGAGCSMADMADLEQVEEAWAVMREQFEGDRIIPITYVNSSAEIKAFVGRSGGAVCTSSNAMGVLKWAFERGERVLFLPDQHLGRNTGAKMGIPLEQMAVWDPLQMEFEAPPEQVANARILLWKGWCSVHQRFTPEQVASVRARYPGIQVIVHPECDLSVVQVADASGSTEFIIRQVREAAPGAKFAIGTEINLVHRLAQEHPDKTVISLSETVCPCSTMYRISPQHLCWTLENLVQGRVVNPIRVPSEIARDAKLALDRMLAIIA